MITKKRILAITSSRRIVDTGHLTDAFVFQSNAPLDDFFSTCNNYAYLRVSRQKNKLFWELDLHVWKAQPRLSVSREKTSQGLVEIINDLPDCRLLVDNNIFGLFLETSKTIINLEVMPWIATFELSTSHEQ